MTWQDELRDLDSKLAAGSISADDYRIARDEILRQAHSGTSQSTPVGPPPADPSPIQQPKPDQGSGPFAPPFKWEKQSPQGESTQMIHPTGPHQPGESDRTQVVSNAPSGETTQVVPGPTTAGPPTPGPWTVTSPDQQQGQGGSPWPPLPGPGQQHPPQWGTPEFDPVVAPNTGWMMQGPESFENISPSTPRKRILGIVVAAVLVVALAVAGVIYFVNRGSDQPEAGQPNGNGPGTATNGPTSSTRKLPEPPAVKEAPADTATALVEPPGSVRGGGGALEFATLQSKGLLPDPVVAALEQARMTDGLLKTTSVDQLTVGMYALTVDSENDAKKVAEAYGAAQRQGGLPLNEDLSLQGVPVYSTPQNAKDHVFRAVYVLYARVVIVETFGPADRQAVQQQFVSLLTEQVEHAPPSLRDL